MCVWAHSAIKIVGWPVILIIIKSKQVQKCRYTFNDNIQTGNASSFISDLEFNYIWFKVTDTL